jgi:hypothetical protein
VQDLTTAQILFLGLAGMEDAQIKSGNGLVKREAAKMQEGMTTSEYSKMRKMKQPGTEEHKELQEKRQRQSGLRKLLDGKVRQLVQEDQRYR